MIFTKSTIVLSALVSLGAAAVLGDGESTSYRATLRARNGNGKKAPKKAPVQAQPGPARYRTPHSSDNPLWEARLLAAQPIDPNADFIPPNPATREGAAALQRMQAEAIAQRPPWYGWQNQQSRSLAAVRRSRGSDLYARGPSDPPKGHKQRLPSPEVAVKVTDPNGGRISSKQPRPKLKGSQASYPGLDQSQYRAADAPSAVNLGAQGGRPDIKISNDRYPGLRRALQFEDWEMDLE